MRIFPPPVLNPVGDRLAPPSRSDFDLSDAPIQILPFIGRDAQSSICVCKPGQVTYFSKELSFCRAAQSAGRKGP